MIGLGSRSEVGEEGGIMNDPQFSDYVDSGMHMGLDPGIGKWGGGEVLRRKMVYSDSDT